MNEPKQIAYFYDTVLADEETELDLDGTVAVPVKRRHSSARREDYGGSINVETDRTGS